MIVTELLSARSDAVWALLTPPGPWATTADLNTDRPEQLGGGLLPSVGP